MYIPAFACSKNLFDIFLKPLFIRLFTDLFTVFFYWFVCVLFQEGGSEGEEGIPQTVSDNLYVVESAQLDLQEEDASIMLTRGPSLPPSLPLSPSLPPSLPLFPSLSLRIHYSRSYTHSLCMFLSLSTDPVLPYRYFTSHGDGVHMITLPWLNRVDQFTTTNSTQTNLPTMYMYTCMRC